MSTTTPAAPKHAANVVQIVPAARLEQARHLSAVARQSSSELLEHRHDPIMQAVVLANSIGRMREALTPEIMSDLLKLADTPLGFKTDEKSRKDNPNFKYPDAVIKDCLIQAMIRGVRPTGNEFNILVGQCYVTKDGFRRLLKEFPGFANLKIDLGVPRISGEGAVVKCSASWTLAGTPDSLECEIPVKGAGCDLLLGKAESKLYRRIYSRLTGSDLADVGSAEESPIELLVGVKQAEG